MSCYDSHINYVRYERDALTNIIPIKMLDKNAVKIIPFIDLSELSLNINPGNVITHCPPINVIIIIALIVVNGQDMIFFWNIIHIMGNDRNVVKNDARPLCTCLIAFVIAVLRVNVLYLFTIYLRYIKLCGKRTL